jgi:glycosyltransferase involved in cell wall biosynthesis
MPPSRRFKKLSTVTADRLPQAGVSAPLLSACLIVKNEANSLKPCLESLRGVADEIVVVDTGSTDATKKIARRHGARVYPFRWIGDFSAARNRSLELARGQWILFIDADETIRRGTARGLRSLLKRPGAIAYYVGLAPRPGYTAASKIRIFKNDPRIRFSGVIHEDAARRIYALSAAGAGKIGRTKLIIDHEGYEGDQTAKHTRNLPLLLKAVRRDRPRPINWFHLSQAALALGKTRLADRAAQKGLALVRRTPWMLPESVLGYIGFIERELRHGRDTEVIFEEALRRCPGDPFLHWMRTQQLMKAKRFGEAVPHLMRLIEWRKKPFEDHFGYDINMFDRYPYPYLATCYFQLGDYAASRRYFALAAKREPENLEYRVKLALSRKLARGKVPKKSRVRSTATA